MSWGESRGKYCTRKKQIAIVYTRVFVMRVSSSVVYFIQTGGSVLSKNVNTWIQCLKV